jgi:hypothetical protein
MAIRVARIDERREEMSSDTPRAPLPSVLLGLLAEFVIALPMLAALVLLYLETGPWLWLVRLQLALFSAYYPKYTFVVYFLLTLGVTALLYAILTRTGLRGRPVIGWFLTVTLGWWVSLPSGLALVLGLPLVAALILLGIGGYEWSRAVTAGPRTEVRAEDLEAGRDPGSRWLVVRGRPLTQVAVTWTQGQTVKGRTIPLVSPAWAPTTPVAVLLHYSSDAATPVSGDPAAFEGTARPGGVPGLTRDAVEKRGLRLASDAVLIDVGSKPNVRRENALLMLTIGGIALPVMIAACLLVAWLRRRWGRPTPEVQPS